MTESKKQINAFSVEYCTAFSCHYLSPQTLSGMTKLINHYLLNDSWHLVDLPGYGFAKTAGRDDRDRWIKFTKVGLGYGGQRLC